MRQDILDRLDPRNPLVVDTRELGRRPGSMRRVTCTVPAPANMGVEVIGVPEGTEFELRLMLEAVMEGVLVSGETVVPLAGECVRCLEPLERTLEVDFQELYVYPDRDYTGDAGDGSDGGEDVPHMVGDLIDLEPELRDAVVLALPLQPVCREDCQGLCTECGASLNDDPDHHHDVADPRWAALQGIFGDSAGEAEDNPDEHGVSRADENQEK